MPIVTENIETSSLTHTGTIRKKNEDALVAMPKAGLWAVADGMGGHEAGDYASQCIIGHLYQAGLAFNGMNLVNKVPDILKAANLEIFNYARQRDEESIVGSTVTLLIMEGDKYHCFWSGDSRCYLLRENIIKPLTQDHTEAYELFEQGRISADQIETCPESNVLTQAIGIDEIPYIDYTQDYIYEDDRFLLCTDGITKVFSDQKIQMFLQEKNIDKINQGFLNEALEAGAPDNLSSIIIGLL
ncbi:protein phosphatase 2C domain-containing protein [Aurantivibrio infirmus]